jgi:thiol-disulfide isomerase/thioredoxin
MAALLFFSNNQQAANLFTTNESETEIVYFFTHHCEACYDISRALSLWANVSGKKITRVPVIDGDDFIFGARMHFLLSVSKYKYDLTNYERHIAAYSLVVNTKIEPKTDYEFAALLREHGMQFSPIEFLSWWNISTIMLHSSKEIVDEVSLKKSSPPAVRVSRMGRVLWVYYDVNSKNEESEFLRDLNTAIKELES